MIQPKSACRPMSHISAKLDRKLTAYVAVASAAGFGVLAASPNAQAEVVYTPTNVTIGLVAVPVDLNNDGTADFQILIRECGSRSLCLDIDALATGNGIRGARSTVAAEFFGARIGPGEQFLTGSGNPSYGNLMANYNSGSAGPWAHTSNRYLGLRFVINGETHYGWARMSVNFHHSAIFLTGYAYETIANKNIAAGERTGAIASDAFAAAPLLPISQEATLGMLARGADGLAGWRREAELTE